VSSAKGFYDTQSNEVTQLAANFVMLDRVLAIYGSEAADARATLHAALADQMESTNSPGHSNKAYSSIKSGKPLGIDVFEKIQGLSPKDDNQRSLKGQALNTAFQIGQTCWLMFEQNTVPIPSLLLDMLVLWLIVLFLSFGIFAPRNLTVMAGLFMAAILVCGAILLIIEMYHPQTGLIQVSDALLRAALAQVSQ